MEGWALRLLSENTPLYQVGKTVGVHLKEWMPAFVPSTEVSVSERGAQNS